jgi:membrane-associated protein
MALFAAPYSYGRPVGARAFNQRRNFVASYIDPLIAFVSANAWLAYLTLFLAALLEAVPIVGSVIPGSTVILALSALVPSGELKLQWVLLAAIAGALVGDGSAFWAGHRSQREILSAWPLTNYPRVVAQSEAFFQRWGNWAVFFARFIPPIRAFVPMTAGALAMPPSRFFPVNLLAVLLWAPAHVLPGVMAVSLLDRFGVFKDTGGSAKHHWMPIIVGAAIILALAVWTIRRRNGGGAVETAPRRVKDLR